MPSVLFVDDEPLVLSGLRRTLRSLRTDWSMNFAVGPEEAESFLVDNPADVVVSDLRMPNMDGSRLLANVAVTQPSAIRFVLSGYADRECVLRTVSTAHQFIPKPCPPEQLIEWFSLLGKLYGPDFTDDERNLIATTERLPACRTCFDEATALFANGVPSQEQIEAVVRKDAAISIQLLRLAAGGYFARPKPELDLRDAIDRLGPELIAKLITEKHIVEPVSDDDDALKWISAVNAGVESDDTAQRLSRLGLLLCRRQDEFDKIDSNRMAHLANILIQIWGFSPDIVNKSCSHSLQ